MYEITYFHLQEKYILKVGSVPLRGPIGWRSFVSGTDDEGMLGSQLVQLWLY